MFASLQLQVPPTPTDPKAAQELDNAFVACSDIIDYPPEDYRLRLLSFFFLSFFFCFVFSFKKYTSLCALQILLRSHCSHKMTIFFVRHNPSERMFFFGRHKQRVCRKAENWAHKRNSPQGRMRVPSWLTRTLFVLLFTSFFGSKLFFAFFVVFIEKQIRIG
jgi:hypothetical protein